MNTLERRVKWILVTVLMAVILLMAICMFGLESEEKKDADHPIMTSHVERRQK